MLHSDSLNENIKYEIWTTSARLTNYVLIQFLKVSFQNFLIDSRRNRESIYQYLSCLLTMSSPCKLLVCEDLPPLLKKHSSNKQTKNTYK